MYENKKNYFIPGGMSPSFSFFDKEEDGITIKPLSGFEETHQHSMENVNYEVKDYHEYEREFGFSSCSQYMNIPI